MIDTLLRFKNRAMQTRALERFGLTPREYVLATLHRPSNVDDSDHLSELMDVLESISVKLPVLLPLHPRTQLRLSPAWMSALGFALWLRKVI